MKGAAKSSHQKKRKLAEEDSSRRRPGMYVVHCEQVLNGVKVDD